MKAGVEPATRAVPSTFAAVAKPNQKKRKTLYHTFLRLLLFFAGPLLFQIIQWTLVGRCIFVTITGQFTVLTLSKANLQTEATRRSNHTGPGRA